LALLLFSLMFTLYSGCLATKPVHLSLSFWASSSLSSSSVSSSVFPSFSTSYFVSCCSHPDLSLCFWHFHVSFMFRLFKPISLLIFKIYHPILLCVNLSSKAALNSL
jgi:hypothetical protein